jgi:hypothetical protein
MRCGISQLRLTDQSPQLLQFPKLAGELARPLLAFTEGSGLLDCARKATKRNIMTWRLWCVACPNDVATSPAVN